MSVGGIIKEFGKAVLLRKIARGSSVSGAVKGELYQRSLEGLASAGVAALDALKRKSSIQEEATSSTPIAESRSGDAKPGQVRAKKIDSKKSGVEALDESTKQLTGGIDMVKSTTDRSMGKVKSSAAASGDKISRGVESFARELEKKVTDLNTGKKKHWEMQPRDEQGRFARVEPDANKNRGILERVAPFFKGGAGRWGTMMKWLGRASVVGAGAYSAYDEYQQSGDIGRAGAAGIGSGGGAYLGGMIGHRILPFVGGILGGAAGSWLGEKGAVSGYDYLTGKFKDIAGMFSSQNQTKDGELVAKADKLEFKADKIRFEVEDTVTFTSDELCGPDDYEGDSENAPPDAGVNATPGGSGGGGGGGGGWSGDLPVTGREEPKGSSIWQRWFGGGDSSSVPTAGDSSGGGGGGGGGDGAGPSLSDGPSNIPAAPTAPGEDSQKNYGGTSPAPGSQYEPKSKGPTISAPSPKNDAAPSSTPSPEPQVAVPGQARLKVVGNALARGGHDRRLVDIATEASRYLPEGYRAEVYSGYRPGQGQSYHGKGQAIDLRLIDPSGKPLANYQNPKDWAAYERFAQHSRKIQTEKYPELNNTYRWGGYFGGPFGKYGAADLMHFDLGPTGMTAAGSWEKGLNEQHRRMWGVRDALPGMGDVRRFQLPPVITAQPRMEERRGPADPAFAYQQLLGKTLNPSVGSEIRDASQEVERMRQQNSQKEADQERGGASGPTSTDQSGMGSKGAGEEERKGTQPNFADMVGMD